MLSGLYDKHFWELFCATHWPSRRSHGQVMTAMETGHSGLVGTS